MKSPKDCQVKRGSADLFSFPRLRSDQRISSLGDRRWYFSHPRLQSGQLLPYGSQRWRQAPCHRVRRSKFVCSWYAGFEWRSDNESLGQTKMCCFNMQVAVSVCLSVLGNRVPATEVTASSIRQVPRNSGPTAGCLLLQLCKTSSCLSNMLKPKEARTSQRYCQNIQREFWIILSFQGKCGQSDPLECHWLRSIDILGIRSFLALQATQCQIHIHHDPPSFPSFDEVSGVHGPRHGLR